MAHPFFFLNVASICAKNKTTDKVGPNATYVLLCFTQPQNILSLSRERLQMLLIHNNGLLSNCHFILNMHFRHVENCHLVTELGVDIVIVTHIRISTIITARRPRRVVCYLIPARSHTFRQLCVSAFPTHIPKTAGLFCAYFTQQTPFL